MKGLWRRCLRGGPVASLLILGEAFVLGRLMARHAGMTYLNNPRIPGDSGAVFHCFLLGLGTTALAAAAVACLLSFLPRRAGRTIWVGFLSLLCLEFVYRSLRGAPFDARIFLFNIGLLRFWSSWKVIGAVGGAQALMLGGLLVLLALISRKFDLFELPSELDPRLRIAVAAASVALAVVGSRSLAFADKWNSSDVYLLFRSAASGEQEVRWVDEAELSRELKTPFPLLRTPSPSHGAKGARPNIIVVFLESFPGELLFRRLPDGRPVTPVLNGLSKRGLFVRRFFSNSVQTAPAYVSTHCGLLPSAKKIESDYSDRSFRCLPAILKDAGYETVLYYPEDASYDNTKDFFRRNGFDRIVSLDGDLPDPRCSARVLMGLRDDCIFSNVLTDLENRKKERGGKKPLYVSLLTTVTHFPFTFPEGFQKPIANPSSAADDQANVAALGDRFLGEFLTRLDASPALKDTLVVVVGDHSFPTSRGDRDGVQGSNEVGLTERHVAVPFFMIWRGHVAPRTIETSTYSQIDIAPTLLDLLKLDAPNSFVGRTILNEDSENVAPIVQPYSGKILGAIRFPYFYRLDERNASEKVVLLGGGGSPERELEPGEVPPKTLEALRSSVQRIFLNERLLSEDRIFPRETAAAPEVARP